MLHAYAGPTQIMEDDLSKVSLLATLTVCNFKFLFVMELFATPWTAACQPSLPLTISPSLPKFMSIELVMPSNHLILCHLLLLLLIFYSIRVFSSELALRIR